MDLKESTAYQRAEHALSQGLWLHTERALNPNRGDLDKALWEEGCLHWAVNWVRQKKAQKEAKQPQSVLSRQLQPRTKIPAIALEPQVLFELRWRTEGQHCCTLRGLRQVSSPLAILIYNIRSIIFMHCLKGLCNNRGKGLWLLLLELYSVKRT